jgi:hypothetical protein
MTGSIDADRQRRARDAPLVDFLRLTTGVDILNFHVFDKYSVEALAATTHVDPDDTRADHFV